MNRYGNRVKLLGSVAVLIGGTACFGQGGVLGSDENEDVVYVGTIAVSTTTTGAMPDPDGYLALLDEGRAQPIGVNGSVTFDNVPVGTYNVRLDGYANNCVVMTPNPAYVVLVVDSAHTTHFDVDCP
jgi:hypothetical protein